MADPKIPKQPQAEQYIPPTSAAEAEANALKQNHFANFQAAKKGSPTAVLPFGVRIDASPHVNARYEMGDESKVLGAPESIVEEDFRREHAGWTYMWPLKDAYRTQAYIASGRYVKVPFSAIDRRNPSALVAESPTGDTIWMRHILVAVSPEVYAQEVTRYESYAVGRTAANRASAEAELDKQFGKAGYKGEFSITDIKQER